MSRKYSRRSFLALGAVSTFTAAVGYGAGNVAHHLRLPEEDAPEDEDIRVSEEQNVQDLIDRYQVPSVEKAKELNHAIQFEQALCAAIGGGSVPSMYALIPPNDHGLFSGFSRYSSRITASGISAALATYPVNALDDVIRSSKITPDYLQDYFGLAEQHALALYEDHKVNLVKYAGVTASLMAVLSPD